MRDGERAVALPDEPDAGLLFIGRIRTPWTARSDCPKNGRASHAACTIEVDPLYAEALAGVEAMTHLLVLYWMDEAARDLVIQRPRHHGAPRGTFTIRSPVRPNPIALSTVEVVCVQGCSLQVRGLDCRDGTPLLDLKPFVARLDAWPVLLDGHREAG